jgi:hypothetical protein
MELFSALQSENKGLKDVISNISAERIALDQLLVMHFKDNVLVRTELVKALTQNNKLLQELALAKGSVVAENPREITPAPVVEEIDAA